MWLIPIIYLGVRYIQDYGNSSFILMLNDFKIFIILDTIFIEAYRKSSVLHCGANHGFALKLLNKNFGSS